MASAAGGIESRGERKEGSAQDEEKQQREVQRPVGQRQREKNGNGLYFTA